MTKLKGELKTHYLKEEILESGQVKRKERKRNKSQTGVQPKIGEEKSTPPLFLPFNLKVIGVGGGGCSIVSEIAREINGKGFIAANTDLQSLNQIISPNITCFQFGKDLTFGLGTGMNPDLGKAAAEKEKGKIKKILKGTEFCILISCLGGGTGSGASPIFAEICKELKSTTLGIFTLPFEFEGRKRFEIAKESLEKLKPSLNAFIVIPNDRIFQMINKKTSLIEAFSTINKFLAENLEGLIEMIYSPGLINIDFADLKIVLEGKEQLAFINTVEVKNSISAEEIAKKVLFNPLCPYSIQGSKRILFNITGGENLSLEEVNQVSLFISNSVKPWVKIIFGISQNKDYENKIKITLLAISKEEEKKEREREKAENFKSQVLKIIKNDGAQEQEQKPEEIKKEEVEKEKEEKKNKIEKRKIKRVKKMSIKKSEKELVEVSGQTKSIKETEDKSRKNAIELRNEVQKEERKMLVREKRWDIPAFLRKNKKGKNSFFIFYQLLALSQIKF